MLSRPAPPENPFGFEPRVEAAQGKLRSLLDEAGIGGGQGSDLDRLPEDKAGPHAVLMHLLVHLDFDERAAREHWRRIRDHRRVLAARVGRDVGALVATLDYFQNSVNVLRSPTIVERAAYEATEREALVDPLTGLFNRRHFRCSLEREVERAQRYDGHFSLALFDLDDFKSVNDTRGHGVGDQVLIHCAAVIRRNLRQVDLPFRFGGEEFAVIIPDTDAKGGFTLAERIRDDLESLFARVRFAGRTLELTMSGGVAGYPGDALSAAELTVRADRALYRAKHDGKNRIALWSQSTPESEVVRIRPGE
jgi:diguanylate cyclase (GGDEF)-like protein